MIRLRKEILWALFHFHFGLDVLDSIFDLNFSFQLLITLFLEQDGQNSLAFFFLSRLGVFLTARSLIVYPYQQIYILSWGALEHLIEVLLPNRWLKENNSTLLQKGATVAVLNRYRSSKNHCRSLRQWLSNRCHCGRRNSLWQ